MGTLQRFQMDHLPLLREAYEQTGLLKREGGILLVETIDNRQIVGFVRYTMLSIPDADLPHPEIGFGIPEVTARGKGYAKEGVRLLVEYLFAGYPAERVAAFTDGENNPAQRVMESVPRTLVWLLSRCIPHTLSGPTPFWSRGQWCSPPRARRTRKWQRTCWPG
jgi:hypothetical protein